MPVGFLLVTFCAWLAEPSGQRTDSLRLLAARYRATMKYQAFGTIVGTVTAVVACVVPSLTRWWNEVALFCPKSKNWFVVALSYKPHIELASLEFTGEYQHATENGYVTIGEAVLTRYWVLVLTKLTDIVTRSSMAQNFSQTNC